MICTCRVCHRVIYTAGGPGADRQETCDQCAQMVNPNKSGGTRQKPAAWKGYLVVQYGEDSVRIEIDQDDDAELFQSIAQDLGFEKAYSYKKTSIDPPRTQEEIMKADIIAGQIYEVFKKIKGR